MDNPAATFDAECPIHMGPVENPRLLPCGHEFCQICLTFVRARNRGRIICPLCKQSTWVNSVDRLTPGASTTAATESRRKLDRSLSSGAPNQPLADDISLVICELSNVEKCCDESVEKLEEMIAEILGIKSSSEQKRKALRDVAFEQPENKRGVSGRDTCEFLLKSTQILYNELFLELNSHLPKFLNAIGVYKDMDIPVFYANSEISSKCEEMFKFASSLFLQLPVGEYDLLASSMARYLQGQGHGHGHGHGQSQIHDQQEQQTQDDSKSGTSGITVSIDPEGQPQYAWVAASGRKGGYWSSHDDYFQLDLGGTLIIACPCSSPLNFVPVNKEEMQKFLDELSGPCMTTEWKQDTAQNPAVFIRDQLESETGLAWHAVVGVKGQFDVESSKKLFSLCTADVGDMRFVVWQG